MSAEIRPLPQRPSALIPQAGGMPAELRARDQWVCWGWEYRPEQTKPWTKPPVDAFTAKMASTTAPDTWNSHAMAVARYTNQRGAGRKLDGIGYVLTAADGLVGVDLDHCRDPETGKLEAWAEKIVGRLNSYTEVTPSGTGLRIFVCGALPPGGRKRGDVEMYADTRFLTVTGHRLPNTSATIEDRTEEILVLHREWFGDEPGASAAPVWTPAPGPLLPQDEVLVERLREKDARFDLLWAGTWEGVLGTNGEPYPSQSEADLALCSIVANAGADQPQVDRIFRHSGLMREKWDQGAGRRTIDRAFRDFEESSPTIAGGSAPPIALAAGPAGGRVFEGLGDFLAQEMPAPDVLIEDVLTDDGSGFIGGEEKLGKTFYALAEACALSTGSELAGRFSVPERRRVLFIEEEDSQRRAQRRLKAILRGIGVNTDDVVVRSELNNWFRLSVWQGFKLDKPEWIRRLETEICEFRPAVVYLDVLRKLTTADMNKAVEVVPMLEALDGLRRKYGTVFRVLHHYRKSQGQRSGRGSQEMGGSYVLGAWAEQSVYLEPIGRKGKGVSFTIQSKDLPPGGPMAFKVESEGPRHDPIRIFLTVEDQEIEQGTKERNPDKVLKALETVKHTPSPDGAGATLDALAEETKLSKDATKRALVALRREGLVKTNEAKWVVNLRYVLVKTDPQTPGGG